MNSGSIPFGMQGRKAASYAHKALDLANQCGTAIMMALAQLLIQMLIESLQIHAEARKLRRYEQTLRQLKELEHSFLEMRLALEQDKDSASSEGFSQSPTGNKDKGGLIDLVRGGGLKGSAQSFKEPSLEKQREIALKLKQKHEMKSERRHGRNSGHDGLSF